MDMKLLAGLGAAAVIAVAATASRLDLDAPSEMPALAIRAPAEPHSVDRLDGMLIHCAEQGEAGGRDPTCLKAWAENRRRFLGLRPKWPDEATEVPARPASAGDATVTPPVVRQAPQPSNTAVPPSAAPTTPAEAR
ncbi:MAG: putative entry exclusion protein TrbK-alt [Xanthobacteraceae bacterium]|nr:putative entry exclusion protein TrbK-alt [Xanthobacteraceae bacterium]